MAQTAKLIDKKAQLSLSNPRDVIYTPLKSAFNGLQFRH